MIERTPIAIFQGQVNPFNEIDYLAEARQLVTAQFENKDIFDRYLQILITSKPELSAVFKQVMQERSLDNAVGVQLDTIGEIVGQDRVLFDSAIIYYFGFNGAAGASPYGTVAVEETVGFWKSINDPALGVRSLTDAEYRTLIKIKIIKNTSNADITSFSDAVRLLFGTDDLLYQENDATITININREYNDQTMSVFPGLDEVVLASRFLNVPIGVQLFLQPPETLSLDFVNQSYSVYEKGEPVLQPKIFSDLIDFSRSSSATYFDSSGVLQTAATDVPRFNYDPSTLNPKGFLIEDQGTNILNYSEDFSGYSLLGASLTAAATTSPRGDVTATQITATQNNGVRIYDTYTAQQRTNFVIAVFAKAGTYGYIKLAPFATTGTHYGSTFDLINGTVLSNTGGTGDIIPINNGWYLCLHHTDTNTFHTKWGAFLTSYTGNSDSGWQDVATSPDVGEYIYIWGSQTEYDQSFLSSYIPTNGSQVTRSADLVEHVMGDEFNSESGTIYSEIELNGTENITFFLALGSSNANRRVQFVRRSNGNLAAQIVINGNVIGIVESPYVTGTIHKFAASYSTNGWTVAINGASISGTDNAFEAVGPLKIGRSAVDDDNAGSFHQRLSTYTPNVLSATELENLTT